METPLFVRFSSGAMERVLPVFRCQQLRDLQQGLCEAFRASFPSEMAVVTTDTGKCFEDFQSVPFKDVPHEIVEVQARVEFLATDNPYFYDVWDRRGRKVSLQEEMRWEDAKNNGAMSLDLNAWIENERSVAKTSLSTPPIWDGSDWCLSDPSGIASPSATDLFQALWLDTWPAGKGWGQRPFPFDLKVPLGFCL
jgi:hypothetical protein